VSAKKCCSAGISAFTGDLKKTLQHGEPFRTKHLTILQLMFIQNTLLARSLIISGLNPSSARNSGSGTALMSGKGIIALRLLYTLTPDSEFHSLSPSEAAVVSLACQCCTRPNFAETQILTAFTTYNSDIYLLGAIYWFASLEAFATCCVHGFNPSAYVLVSITPRWLGCDN
jgi:hypothetical protein